TIWVPEFSRDYALNKPDLDSSDVEPIARGQIAREDEALLRANKLLILDTDLVSTLVYSHHYYGACPQWIEFECRRRLADLYLLLYPDVPWIADGIRDRGDRRLEMHELFVRALKLLNANFITIDGEWKEREQKAAAAIENM